MDVNSIGTPTENNRVAAASGFAEFYNNTGYTSNTGFMKARLEGQIPIQKQLTSKLSSDAPINIVTSNKFNP